MTETVLAHGELGGHGAHIAMLLVLVVVMIGLAVGADIRRWQYRNGRAARPTLTAPVLAGGLSLLAAAIHAAVCPAHFTEAALYGWFFALSAVVQLGWAVLVLIRRSRSLLWLGLTGNLAVVVLWAATRTVGLPYGPEAGTVEAVGPLDVVASLAEVGVVVACALMLRRAWEASPATYRPSFRTNALGSPSK